MQLKYLICEIEFDIGRKFLLQTLVISLDRFVSHLNMFINCPNVLLLVDFVQFRCDLTFKYVGRFQSMFTELKLMIWAVSTLNLASCDAGKKLVLMLRIQQYF